MASSGNANSSIAVDCNKQGVSHGRCDYEVCLRKVRLWGVATGSATMRCDLQLLSAISNQRDAKQGVIFNCCSWQVDSCHSPACPRFFKLYVVIAANQCSLFRIYNFIITMSCYNLLPHMILGYSPDVAVGYHLPLLLWRCLLSIWTFFSFNAYW